MTSPDEPDGTTPVAGTGDGHASEQHRLRRTRGHLLFSLVAVLIFAIAFVAIWGWAANRSDVAPTPDPSQSSVEPPAPVSQETLLVQATTGQGAIGNVLTGLPATAGPAAGDEAAAPGDDGAVVSSPVTVVPLRADLVVNGVNTGPELLEQTVATLDTLRPANSVAVTLGVRVDASWRLDRKALAGLVDAVGGLPVKIVQRERIRDEAGDVVLVLRPGRQRLSGTNASWYAVGTQRGADAEQAAARFARVLTATLRRLPDSDVAIREALTALGALAPSTIGTQELADYLLDLSRALRAGTGESVALPVRELPVATTTAAWVRYPGATPRLRAALPYAQWRAGVDGPARALVVDPHEDPAAVAGVRGRLQAAGMLFVSGWAMQPPTERRTTVVGRGDPTVVRTAAAAVAAPRPRIKMVPADDAAGAPWADVDLVLGADVPESAAP